MKTVAILGTFDSKGTEFLFAKNLLEKLGVKTLTINTGIFEPMFTPDVSNKEVAAAAGYDLEAIVAKRDRGTATAAMCEGAKAIVPKLFKEGKFDGIISFGGSGGTSMACPAMRELPVGVPKVMVSTLASGDVAGFVGSSDIVMMPSIVDVAGINKISKTIFSNACMAIAGMVGMADQLPQEEEADAKPLIAATMFGVTTPCIEQAKAYMEKAGYEVLVFHATGTGGKCMESLINAGFFAGALDLTTTEWCDEVVGGILAAGPDRCSAAVKCKIPQVVSVGATDMVNFGPMENVPAQFQGRNLYKHNPSITLMRTTPEENVIMGQKMAAHWDKAESKMLLMLPLKGVSMIDAEGQPFEDVEARQALYASLKENINNENVEILEMDAHINDKVFAETAAQRLIDLIEAAKA